MSSPLLYLSLAFKRHREEYYRRLNEVRASGDWEGWTAFFLSCVQESADDAVDTAHRLFVLLGHDRQLIVSHKAATVYAIRLLDLLVEHPIVTMPMSMELLKTTKPTASKAIDALCRAGILHEITGKRRDRVYAYRNYLKVLAEDTDVLPIRQSGRNAMSTATLRNVTKRYGSAIRRLTQIHE